MTIRSDHLEHIACQGQATDRKKVEIDWLQTIMTTGLAGGLTKPYKGIRPAALTRSESPPTASLFTGSR